MSNEFDFSQEELVGGEVNTEVPAVKEKVPQYELANGTMGSRAEFIREQFLNENLSRKEIAEKFDIPYRIVYSATVNMVNNAEAPTRGRSASNAVVKVTADNQLVTEKDGVIYVQGEIHEGEMPETVDKARNEWIQEMVDADVARGDIAKMLDLSYGVIYNLTKDADGVRAKHEVTLEDGTVISRAEYIRKLAAEGKSRGDIAKELDVPYAVVWQATKVAKTEQERFVEAITHLEAFAANVSDAIAFADAIATLKALEMVAPKETEAEAKEEATA